MTQLPPLNNRANKPNFQDFSDLPDTDTEDNDEPGLNFGGRLSNKYYNRNRKSTDSNFDDSDDILNFNDIGNRDPNNYKKNFLFDNYKPRKFTDKEIENCFQSFDLSDTGFLCAAEIKKCFEKLGANIKDEEVDEMLQMCDTSGDGQVEYDEFEVMIYNICKINRKNNKTDDTNDDDDLSAYDGYSSSSLARKKRGKGTEGIHGNRLAALREKAKKLRKLLDNLVGFEMKNMKNIFENFRLMDDETRRPIGLIDYPDFCACLDVEPNKTVQEMFNFFKLNENTSNYPNYMDYRNFLISIVALETGNLEQKIKFTFQVFDIDGNGSIDRQELIQILSATQLLTGKALQDRVDQIIRLADKDGNGELEFDEFAICARRYRNLLFVDV